MKQGEASSTTRPPQREIQSYEITPCAAAQAGLAQSTPPQPLWRPIPEQEQK